jgi:hypothetical protein
LKGKDKLSSLMPSQIESVNYIKKKAEATMEEIITDLHLTEEEFRREFVVLRHVEVLKAKEKGESIFYILF